jgi:hypothetical protein
MEYTIEVDYVLGVCETTHKFDSFECNGNSIDACNKRINQALEKNEKEITPSNLHRARVYVQGREILEVNYHTKTIKLTLSDIVDNWVNLLNC